MRIYFLIQLMYYYFLPNELMLRIFEYIPKIYLITFKFIKRFVTKRNLRKFICKKEDCSPNYLEIYLMYLKEGN